MRARHVGPADQPGFILDHLEGEARDELKYRIVAEREDPETVFNILRIIWVSETLHLVARKLFFQEKLCKILTCTALFSGKGCRQCSLQNVRFADFVA